MEAIDVLNITYDRTRKIKGSNLVLIYVNNEVGLYDIYTNKQVVPTRFNQVIFQGPSLTLHDTDKIDEYALLYLKKVIQ